MKVSCVAMVRNEIDIVETFCRHISALFDEIVLIDHSSEDGTREYLQKVSRRDKRFHLYDFLEPEYEQAALMTFATRNLTPLSNNDWIFLLDADEFLPFADDSSFRSHLDGIRNGAVIYMHWSNLLPKDYSATKFDFSAPIWCSDNLSPYRKIAFRPKDLKTHDYWIAQGAHDLQAGKNGDSLGGSTIELPLFHVPIRSVEQLSLKLAQGIAAYTLRDRSSKSLEGFHWASICDMSRAAGLHPEVLNWVAANYGSPLTTEPQKLSTQDLIDRGYAEKRVEIALDASIPRSDCVKFVAETMLGVCASFAKDAMHTSRRSADIELAVDVHNRIFAKDPKELSRFSAFANNGWPSNESLEGLDDAGFVAKFLRPAFWPIKRLTPTAWAGHIPFMFCLVAALQPRRYVELGTYKGASFFAACQAAQRASPVTECIAVDLWIGDEHTGQYDGSVFETFHDLLKRDFGDVGHFIRSSFDDAVERFDPESIDVLHIDGLHTYEAVKHDFETWRNRMSPEGVIIFHDVNVHERDFGVWELWGELKKTYTTAEFPHSHGLGILCLGNSAHNPVFRLSRVLQENEPQAHFVQWFLQNAGELSAQRFELATHAEESTRLKLRIGQLEREIADERSRRAEVYNSTSWKITAPLRLLSTWFRRSVQKHSNE